MIYLLCSRTLDAKQQPSSVQFFFSFSIIEAVGAGYPSTHLFKNWGYLSEMVLTFSAFSLFIGKCDSLDTGLKQTTTTKNNPSSLFFWDQATA